MNGVAIDLGGSNHRNEVGSGVSTSAGEFNVPSSVPRTVKRLSLVAAVPFTNLWENLNPTQLGRIVGTAILVPLGDIPVVGLKRVSLPI